MPWTTKDVDKHKKGLTPAQKKKWVSIANSILASCKKEGGSDCEGKAIRVANSKFSENGVAMKIPKGAFRLIETGQDCHAFAEDGDDQKSPVLRIKVYSGKPIKSHWYWDDLVIDTSGMSFPKKTYPVLEDHMTSRKIAYSKKPIVGEDYSLSLDPETTKFVSTPESEEFQRLSSEGFPYQASVYAIPSVIERVEDGESVEVNGYKFKGPGTVWRKSEYREGSVCVFGYDSNTQSSAFADKEEEEIFVEEINKRDPALLNGTDDVAVEKTEEEVSEEMTLEELREKHPELVKSIEDAAISTFKAEINKQKESDEAKMSALKTENEQLSEKIVSLEKKDAIRTEKELKMQAEAIWDKKLSQSDVSERLYDKIKGMVRYSKFVEDDVLDVEKFTEAVDAEIEDWVGRGATGTVLGGGFQSKNDLDSKTEKEQQTLKENDDVANKLLKLAGQKVEEDAA